MNRGLILIPTYNEADNIRLLLESLDWVRDKADIVVIDDGSPDGTSAIVSRFANSQSHVHLIARSQKDGLASAYIAGFQWALRHSYEIFIQMDADFSHSPQDIHRLLEGLENADAVIGSRYIEGGEITGWSFCRRGISRWGNVYAARGLGMPYRDLTGGFNAWHRKVLESAQIPLIRSRGYAFQIELKYRAHLAGFKMSEVPISFKDRERGKSKMSARIIAEAAQRVWQLRRLK